MWNNLGFLYQVCFFSINNVNNGLGELSYFFRLVYNLCEIEGVTEIT